MEGCFGTGANLDELVAALSESVGMYVAEADSEQRLLTSVVQQRLEVEPDLRPAGSIPMMEGSGRHRSARRPSGRRTIRGRADS